jgi:hypothetical protein
VRQRLHDGGTMIDAGTRLPTAPVTERTLVTVREFERFVRAGGEPLLVKGWMADWQALSSWDFDFWRSRYGSDPITITDDAGNPVLETTIAEYVDYILDPGGDGRLATLARRLGRTRPFYCLSYKPFGFHTELWEHCNLPPFLADWLPYLNPAFRTAHFPHSQGWIFLGGVNSSGPLHQDSHHTITWFAQVHGRKEFYLYAPEDAEGVYFGAVDAVQPELARYPRFGQVTGRRCVINPGEMLFLPPDWWHQAVALDDSITVSCNFVNHTNFGDYLVAAFGAKLPQVLAALPAEASSGER